MSSSLVHKLRGLSRSPYARLMRLDKPIPIMLALLPALWSVTIVSRSLGDWLFYSVIMVVGAVSARGAGCVINDIWDRELDATVERTKTRPLASKKLTVKQAIMLCVLLSTISLALLLMLNTMALITAVLFTPVIIIYALVKRVSHYAQVVLGVAFNCGVLIAWFAIDPRIIYPPFLLYMAAILWTVGYDTIYAHQDKIDDEKAGVKSMALYLGDKTKDIVWALYQFMAILLVIVGMQCHMGVAYYIGVAAAAYHLYWQSGTVDLDNPKDCAEKFNSNAITGLMIFAGSILGRILPF